MAGTATAGVRFRLCQGLDGEMAVAAAARRNVDVTPVNLYGDRAGREGHLGFAAIENREIRRGVRELAIALESQVKSLQRGGRARAAMHAARGCADRTRPHLRT